MSDNKNNNNVLRKVALEGDKLGSAAMITYAVGGGLNKAATAESSYKPPVEEAAAAP